jgi:5-methylcytosine-specific restriction endonuclease McrA
MAIDWRSAVYLRDNYTCQKCGQRGGRLNAHHVKPFKDFPELAFDVSNGQTLCVPCHKETDTFGWQKYNAWRKAKK